MMKREANGFSVAVCGIGGYDRGHTNSSQHPSVGAPSLTLTFKAF